MVNHFPSSHLVTRSISNGKSIREEKRKNEERKFNTRRLESVVERWLAAGVVSEGWFFHGVRAMVRVGVRIGVYGLRILPTFVAFKPEGADYRGKMYVPHHRGCISKGTYYPVFLSYSPPSFPLLSCQQQSA